MLAAVNSRLRERGWRSMGPRPGRVHLDRESEVLDLMERQPGAQVGGSVRDLRTCRGWPDGSSALAPSDSFATSIPVHTHSRAQQLSYASDPSGVDVVVEDRRGQLEEGEGGERRLGERDRVAEPEHELHELSRQS